MPLVVAILAQIILRPLLRFFVSKNSLRRPVMQFGGSVSATRASGVKSRRDSRQVRYLIFAQVGINLVRRNVKLTVASWVAKVAPRAGPKKVLRSVGEQLKIQDELCGRLAIAAHAGFLEWFRHKSKRFVRLVVSGPVNLAVPVVEQRRQIATTIILVLWS